MKIFLIVFCIILSLSFIISLIHIFKYRQRYTTEIRRSKIHGKGVFALRSFKKGELIETCNFIPQEVRGSLTNYDTTISGFPDGIIIMGIYAFINHGKKNANVAVQHLNVQKQEAKIYAIKDIKHGEELLQDYGDEYWCSRNYENCTDFN